MDEEAASKLVFSYNSFLVDFLLLVKRVSPDIKTKVKEHYRSIDKREKEHIDFGVENLPLAGLSRTKPAEISTADEDILNSQIVVGVTVRDIIGCEDEPELRNGILRNLYVICALARLREIHSSNVEPLLELIMRIQAVGMWAGWPEPAPATNGIDDAIEAIDDVYIRGLLAGLFELCVVKVTSKDDNIPEGLRNVFTTIQDSKIGNIAKEIAEEIDFTGIDVAKPEQWLDLANMTNPNSLLGNIVGKLGSKITAKMSSGELKQEDILADAMSLMKTMGIGAGGSGGTDILQSMMAGMNAMNMNMKK